MVAKTRNGFVEVAIILAATLALWFGASSSDLQYIFPNIVNFPGEENLGFMA